MRITTMILATFSVVANAQELVKTEVDLSIPIVAVTKDVGVAKWTCTDKFVYNQVTVLDSKGTWAKIEYTSYPMRPRINEGGVILEEAQADQPQRVQTWINTLHVVRIEPATIRTIEKKKQNKSEQATPRKPSD